LIAKFALTGAGQVAFRGVILQMRREMFHFKAVWIDEHRAISCNIRIYQLNQKSQFKFEIIDFGEEISTNVNEKIMQNFGIAGFRQMQEMKKVKAVLLSFY
jgi:hypothetical protein